MQNCLWFFIVVNVLNLLFHFLYISAVFAISFTIFRIRTRSLRKSNLKLKQRDRIARDVQKQKEILHLRNKEIEDSLNYAHGIQKAMLINHKQFREILPDSFIVHKSKDIVSGDFYWISRLEDKIIIAAVDCTGHGVPGAFMSLIGFELFRKIINTQNIHQADKILAALNTNLFEIFQNEERTILRDGMDLALCILYKDQNCLDFAGSFCPLYLLRENSILEIRGDHFHIGAEFSDGMPVNNTFTNNRVDLKPDDMIYIFTDGYADQFGGPEGKKFKYRRFRHLLLTIHKLPLENQKEILEKSLEDWRGNLPQVDDVLIIGFRYNQP